MKPISEKLKQQEKELEEDIDILTCRITEIEETKENNWEKEVVRLQSIKNQLEKNLEKVQSQLDPIFSEGTDEDSFLLITNKMIDDTIEAHFRYYIWSHPDMVCAIEDFSLNGPDSLKNYSDGIRRWIVTFSSSKYKGNGKKQFEEDFHVHKTWVCIDDPKNPFSFQGCMEHRNNMSYKKLRNLLDELCEWKLDELIDKHELFHSASQRAEKEKIMALRAETANSGLQ